MWKLAGGAERGGRLCEPSLPTATAGNDRDLPPAGGIAPSLDISHCGGADRIFGRIECPKHTENGSSPVIGFIGAWFAEWSPILAIRADTAPVREIPSDRFANPSRYPLAVGSARSRLQTW